MLFGYIFLFWIKNKLNIIFYKFKQNQLHHKCIRSSKQHHCKEQQTNNRSSIICWPLLVIQRIAIINSANRGSTVQTHEKYDPLFNKFSITCLLVNSFIDRTVVMVHFRPTEMYKHNVKRVVSYNSYLKSVSFINKKVIVFFWNILTVNPICQKLQWC